MPSKRDSDEKNPNVRGGTCFLSTYLSMEREFSLLHNVSVCTTYNYDDGPASPCALDDMNACAPVVAARRLLFRSASVKRMKALIICPCNNSAKLTLLLLLFNLGYNPLNFLQREALAEGIRNTKAAEYQGAPTVCLPNDSMTVISIFFAPVWTTSSNDLTVSLIVSARFNSSL